eukprot:6206088-Pleurochrysis_carterae.AAC.2
MNELWLSCCEVNFTLLSVLGCPKLYAASLHAGHLAMGEEQGSKHKLKSRGEARGADTLASQNMLDRSDPAACRSGAAGGHARPHLERSLDVGGFDAAVDHGSFRDVHLSVGDTEAAAELRRRGHAMLNTQSENRSKALIACVELAC